MEVVLYQVNMDRDVNRVCFTEYERLEKYQGSSDIDSAIYDVVYSGNVDVEPDDLEEVYALFNIGKKPDGYRGHSMSCSDVLEVRGEDASRFYFCDSIGFREVAFQPELTKTKV